MSVYREASFSSVMTNPLLFNDVVTLQSYVR